jgi:hypothetical protein
MVTQIEMNKQKEELEEEVLKNRNAVLEREEVFYISL